MLKSTLTAIAIIAGLSFALTTTGFGQTKKKPKAKRKAVSTTSKRKSNTPNNREQAESSLTEIAVVREVKKNVKTETALGGPDTTEMDPSTPKLQEPESRTKRSEKSVKPKTAVKDKSETDSA